MEGRVREWVQRRRRVVRPWYPMDGGEAGPGVGPDFCPRWERWEAPQSVREGTG